jgi:enterochelin esterase-like enzyme
LNSRRLWLVLVAAASACAVTPSTESSPPTAPATDTEILLATPTPSPFPLATTEPSCALVSTIIEEATYAGVAVNRDVPVIFLRPDCELDPLDPLPIVFVLHGKPMTEEQWLDLDLPGLLEGGWQTGRWPPMIVVAPRQPEPLFSGSDGGPGSYEEEFFEGLVPFVDSVLPADTQPPGRAVLGISRGGVWALELGLTHTGSFVTVAALSPALAVNFARAAYDPLDLAMVPGEFPRVYLGAGEGDWARPQTEHLGSLLGGQQAEVKIDITPGGHEEATWAALLPSALDFIALPWGNQGQGRPDEIR